MESEARAAIRQIAKDIAELGLDRDKTGVKKDVFFGMNLALGRLYEQYNREDMKAAGPKKILQWAITVGNNSTIRMIKQ